MKIIFFVLIVTLLTLISSFKDGFYNYRIQTSEVKLNDIQLIGSHNSYKVSVEKPLLDYLFKYDVEIGKSLQYEHKPLIDQLKLGLRSFEFDVFHDPLGGFYSNPKGLDIVKKMEKEPLVFDSEEKLKIPGLKMFHVQDIDFRSNQLLFKEALTELKNWSDNNKNHTPIIITINAKDEIIAELKKPLSFDTKALKNIDEEIKSIFSKEKLITPDIVRGNSKSLEQAILNNGWPLLETMRGKFLFVLDVIDTKNDMYLDSFPGLRNAVLFINIEEGNPEAAFRILNDPKANFNKIKSLVEKGYFVRTRADADTKEARENNYLRFNFAKKSGAQVISTDYYLSSQLFDSNYEIKFKDGGYEKIKNR